MRRVTGAPTERRVIRGTNREKGYRGHQQREGLQGAPTERKVAGAPEGGIGALTERKVTGAPTERRVVQGHQQREGLQGAPTERRVTGGTNREERTYYTGVEHTVERCYRQNQRRRVSQGHYHAQNTYATVHYKKL